MNGQRIVDDQFNVIVVAYDETVLVVGTLPAGVVEDELHVRLAHFEASSSTRGFLGLLGQDECLLDVVVAHRVVLEESREPHEVGVENAELRFQVRPEVHLHLQVAVDADGLGLEDGLEGIKGNSEKEEEDSI